jgi:hypothetical protein
MDAKFHDVPIGTPNAFIEGLTITKLLQYLQGVSFAKRAYQQNPLDYKEKMVLLCGTDATRYITYRIFRVNLPCHTVPVCLLTLSISEVLGFCHHSQIRSLLKLEDISGRHQ